MAHRHAPDNVDSRILAVMEDTARHGWNFHELALKLQEALDEAIEEATAPLQVEVADQREHIRRLSVSMAKEIKATSLARSAHIKMISFARQNEEYLLSVTRSRNPLIRFLAHLASWPTPKNAYHTAKYETANEVLTETMLQDDKWGADRQMPHGTGDEGGFSDELANYFKGRTDKAFAAGEGTWRHILEEEFYEAMAETNPKRLKAELIQVAAVCLSWVVALKMQRKK